MYCGSGWKPQNVTLAFVGALLGAFDPQRYSFYSYGKLSHSYLEFVAPWPKGTLGERYEREQ